MSKMAYWVLEGDWNGQIYLTVPAELVSKAKVAAALCILDAFEWVCNEGEGSALYAMEGHPGDGVWGGMGGGLLTPGLWLHGDLLPSLRAWLSQYFSGEIGLPSPQEMIGWFLREEKRQPKDQSPKELWKRFASALRRAEKALAGVLPSQGPAIGPLINALMSESETDDEWMN